jgi:hypothetical protein
MESQHPYRVPEPQPGPSERWEDLCRWSEDWRSDRFVAQIDTFFAMIVGGIAVSFIVFVLAVMVAPFLGIQEAPDGTGSGLPYAFGGIMSLAAFILVGASYRQRPKVRIEVTPETTTAAWREGTSTPTATIRDVEAFAQENSDGDTRGSWYVRYTSEDRWITMPLLPSSEQEAKMRAERLRAVIALFGSRANPNGRG